MIEREAPRVEVVLLPGADVVGVTHRAAGAQPDNLCGPYWVATLRPPPAHHAGHDRRQLLEVVVGEPHEREGTTGPPGPEWAIDGIRGPLKNRCKDYGLRGTVFRLSGTSRSPRQ